MFVLTLALLLFVNSGNALQCITNCSVGSLRFGQPLRIADRQCQQRTSGYDCGAHLKFIYQRREYSASFDDLGLASDFIYITSGPYLSYTVNYQCSKETSCVLSYAENRVNEMSNRPYDANYIYQQIQPLIENPSRNNSIQCYNMDNQIVTCLSNQVCSLDYDQQAKKARARGCIAGSLGRVSVYDGGSYASFDIECTRNLCNDDETFVKIKTILVNNRLTDDNGRRIAASTKQTISNFLITCALISAIVSYL